MSGKVVGIINTNQGQMEYVHYIGHGVPVVFIHGTPGDCYQADFYLGDMIAKGHEVISISRPGYGRTRATPISKCFARQASAIRSVIDKLGKDKVVIYAVSGGAAVAYKFVSLYGDRCRGLILESPVLGSWHQNNRTWLDWIVSKMYVNSYISKIGQKMLALFPKVFIYMSIVHFGNFKFTVGLKVAKSIYEDETLLDRFRTLFMSTFPEKHIEGFKNDLEELGEDVNYMPICGVPTLILHGEKDREVPIDSVRKFFSNIKNSTFIGIECGHHLLPLVEMRNILERERSTFLNSIE